MKILITGVHGFVGSNFVKVLSKDNEIYGLDIVHPPKEGVIRTYFWEDMDINALPTVDASFIWQEKRLKNKIMLIG